ncbi:hypothetical protein Kpol_1004p12 [Vanderwaltozyma polyspora DSM 70294]|uniref:FHA domain-containing protein n=1 Tax=Vanderwaltozyma polyspora (strain ATCC 22028 / DSM 70294 / BCRC 21397 / CBS 2163 / NBRC 10782 / NRRL Y-8283 / UCD 57-17) TaxID=436907 RepID=A7TJ70_VANPO|nr:uncharacterized protein Kpol_1004p12 [Vanderwaltozyma polyspora DSM 70294]EDO17639.1 hypothetical protein Kpol_1004p12 [Vanderwaltozyma polyspora DSM 70294]
MDKFRKRPIYRHGDGGNLIKRRRDDSRIKVLPIFEPSGLLELDACGDRGIQLKYAEPDDKIAIETYWKKHRIPMRERNLYQLVMYRKGVRDPIREFDLTEKSSFLIGRDMGKNQKAVDARPEAKEDDDDREEEIVLADIGIPEETCSKQHCVLQFREVDGQLRLYIIDLDSSNGTVLNGEKLPRSRYVELRSCDVITLSEIEQDVDYELVFVMSN